MYFLYVDESGDNGASGSPYFILCGLVIRFDRWNDFFDVLKGFRQSIRDKHRFLSTYELHSRDLLRSSGFFSKTGLHLAARIAIYQESVAFLSRQDEYVRLMAVSIDKSKKWGSHVTYAEKAWQLLIQRFDNFLYRNSGYGIIIADAGYKSLARKVYRKMRVYNPIPSKKETMDFYFQPLKLVLEDPNWKDSKESYFLQLVDVACNAVKLEVVPSKRAKRKRYSDVFKLLKPIAIPAISKTGDGIVHYP